MDEVFIEGLQVDALIGVYDAEREAKQPLLLDIRLGYDNRHAAKRDAVADTVDYAQVCAQLRAFVDAHQPQLLETLAEALAAHLLQAFDASDVRLRIRKPEAARALGAASVGVEIRRERTA